MRSRWSRSDGMPPENTSIGITLISTSRASCAIERALDHQEHRQGEGADDDLPLGSDLCRGDLKNGQRHHHQVFDHAVLAFTDQSAAPSEFSLTDLVFMANPFASAVIRLAAGFRVAVKPYNDANKVYWKGSSQRKGPSDLSEALVLMVGTARFELATYGTQNRRATRLRYAPMPRKQGDCLLWPIPD